MLFSRVSLNVALYSSGILIFLNSIVPVTSIKCYQCNSIKDSECENIAGLIPQQGNAFLKDCDGDYHGEDPFCRTIDLTILHNKQRRVVRSCGWAKSTDECYKADNDDHLERVCQCFKDGCNSARSWSGITLKMVTFIFSIFVLRNYFY